MPKKLIVFDGIGSVALYKRRGAKSMKLTIGHNGDIRVTLPFWVPYHLGRQFVEQRKEWLISRKPQFASLTDGLRVGKAHQVVLRTYEGSTVRTRVANLFIQVSVPKELKYTDQEVQTAIRHGAIRALKKEAKQLLPQRLDTLALQHDFAYRSVKIKEMRSRWGSCSQHKDIVLNCFLMQLPWELIDYVLLHELLHTRLLKHGPGFWSELANYVSALPDVRKTMRNIQPTLHDQPARN